MTTPVGLMRLGACALSELEVARLGVVSTDAILVVKTAGENVSGEGAQKATLMVFDSLDNAKAWWGSVESRILAGTDYTDTDYESANGYKNVIAEPRKRQELHYIVKNWKNLCGAVPAADRDEADLPEIGRYVTMTLPVKDSHDRVHIVQVKGKIDKLTATNVKVVGEWRGVPFEQEMPIVRVRAALKAMGPQDVAYPAAFDTSRGRKLYDLLKKLPLTSKCADGEVDVHDLHGFVEGFSGEKTGIVLKGLGDPDDAMWITNTFIDIYDDIIKIEKLEIETADWPTSSGYELGVAAWHAREISTRERLAHARQLSMRGLSTREG